MVSPGDGQKKSTLFAAPVRLSLADYLIIGPTDAGKTCLLASLYKAAISRSDLPSSVGVRLYPTSREMRDLVGLAEEIPFTPDILPSTSGTRDYQFDLTFSAFSLGRLTRRDEVTRFSMLDGPGGALVQTAEAGLGGQFGERLRNRLRAADGVVLCVDGVESDPAAHYWRQFPHVLASLQASRLSAKRVVICLTKADQYFCERSTGAKRAVEVADPAARAGRILPTEVLVSLRQHLRQGATLGFAWVSTWGFLPDGSANCRPSADGAAYEPKTSGEQVAPGLWTPYHVLDPLLFVGFGFTRENGVRIET